MKKQNRISFLLSVFVFCGVLWSNAVIAQDKLFSIGGNDFLLRNVNSEADILFQSMRFNRALNVWNCEVVLRNKGSNTITGPLALRVESFTGTTGPQNADGLAEAKPFFDLSHWVTNGALRPGEQSAPRTLTLGYSAGQSPTLVCQLYGQSSGGMALGLTRSLNEFGQPMGDVLIEETGPQGQKNYQSDSDSAVISLGQAPGSHRWKFSKPGYLSVWRNENLTSGNVALFGSPRLVLRNTNLITLTASGGEVSDTNGAIHISFSADALAQNVNASLTPLSGQTLPALLPRGWSPLQAFALALSAEPVASAAAALTLWGNVNLGETAAFIRWDETNLVWNVLELVSGSGTNLANVSVPGSGAFALVAGDLGTFAPPNPQAGQPLPGTTAPFTNFANLRAGGRVVPATSPASKMGGEVTAAAELNITNLSGAMPSGTLLRGETTELYILRNETRRSTPRYESFLIGYQRPGDSSPETLSATFPMRPQILLGAEELLEAFITMDVFAPTNFGGGILHPGGGSFSQGGITIRSRVGDVTSAQAIVLRELEATNFATLTSNMVSAFELEVSGMGAGKNLQISLGTNQPNSFFVLARVLQANGIYGLEPVERFASDANGLISSVEPSSGDRLPGLRRAGQYVLIKVDSAQTLVKGIARDSSNAPAAGILVSLHQWMTFSANDGSYRLIAPLGNATVHFTETTSGNAGSTSVNVADVSNPVLADGSASPVGPRVLHISPNPGATAVPRVTSVVVTFSEPINPGSLGTDGVQLIGTNGQPVAASATLNLANTVVTLLPNAQLTPSSLHTIQISTNIADGHGLKLEGTNSFIFTTESDALNRLAAQVISYEPTNGLARMVGSPGVADPESPVILVNESSGRTATVLSKVDGSFDNFIEAEVDDFLSAVFINKNGTMNTIPVSQQYFSDGSVGLFNGGGILEAESEGGPVQVIVEPGAIETKTKLNITPFTTQELTNLLGGIVPQGGKVLAGLKYESSGDDLQVSADLRMPINPAELDIPPGGDPTNGVFAAVIFHEVNGVKVFQIADKIEYKDGYLETHSPPFCGISCFGDAVNVMALWLGYGGKVVAQGRVVSTGEGGERPVRGATVFVAGGPTALEANGRVSEGTVIAVSDTNGEFALLANLQEDSTTLAVLASSLKFPDRFGQGTLRTQEDNPAKATGRVTFVRGAPPAAADDNISPIITMSLAPPEPAVNEIAKFRVFATDNASQPTVTVDVGSVTSLSLSNTVTVQDVTLQLESQTFTANSVLNVYKISARKAAYVTLEVAAVDQNGNLLLTDELITIGGTETTPVPSNSNDRIGPWVLSMTPRHGVRDFNRFQPIRITFSEPVDDSFMGNVTGSISLTPSAGVPFATLSSDKRELTLSYPNLQASTDYVLTINNAHIRDLNGNRFDQNPNNNPTNGPVFFSLDRFTSQFATKGTFFARLPGMANGAGVVEKDGFFFALERKGATGAAALKVYGKDTNDLPVLTGYLRLPDYPRDLVLIEKYPWVDANGQKRTNDIIVATGGLVGSETGQWIWAIDVSHPNSPERLVDTTVTQDPSAVVTKLSWSPPMVGYLEVGSEFSAVGLINLQLFLYTHRLPNLNGQPGDGEPGTDVNGDGDYVDTGDQIPKPAGRRLIQGVLNGGLVNAYTLGETNVADIVDFDLEFGGRFVGVVHGKEGSISDGYRTLAANGVPIDYPDGYYALPNRPDRMLLVFGAQLDRTNGPTAANLALISGAPAGALTVLDITDPEGPLLLSTIPIPSQFGLPKSAVLGTDGNIFLSTSTDIVVVNPRRLLLPPNASGHPAIMGVMQGLGSGSRSFVGASPELFAVNMGGRARVSTTNASYVLRVVEAIGIDRNLTISNAWSGFNLTIPQFATNFSQLPNWKFTLTPPASLQVEHTTSEFKASFAIEKGTPSPNTERRSRNGLLQVVAAATEKYTFDAKIDPDGLSLPPNWPNWKHGTNLQTGPTVEYEVAGYYTNLTDLAFFWADAFLAFRTTPKTNLVTCENQQLVMEVYPPIKASLSFDVSPIFKVFTNTTAKFEAKIKAAYPGLRPTVSVSPPEGKIGYSHEWRECPDSHEAFYTFELKPELDPLLKIRGGWELGHQTPPVLVDISFGLFLGVVASGSVNASLSRSECGQFSGSINPSAKLTLLLSCGFTNSTILSVYAQANSSITVTGQLLADGSSVKLSGFRADSDGINAQLEIKYQDGSISYNPQWNLLGPETLFQGYSASLFEFDP